ncbi:FGGY family carbohydrate kinase [Thermoanaerobacterium thermosaccharolyticum]|uniref:FGGY family carbohydrate kinase n=1 Tax=Thermoanaerobacterium thermosaccharolyticum TaxID=1517 RepID=UPI001CC1E823|nr:FGGY family carbohydrate kinase [Thermoanaerobacterium thermosaccharolyticum]
MKEYVFYKLFGKYYIDYSIASATGLFNIYNMKWNKQSLDVVGINEERLSSPVPATYIVKNLKSEYAYYMNIDSKTPFVIGASDGCLSNLGVNAIKPGNAAVTIGTSGAIRIMSDKPKCDEKERVFSYVLTENHYVVGGAVNNGGVALRWFIDNFASDKVEMAKKLSIDIYDYVIEKASEVPAGSLGLLFLPYILGERAPYWNANAKGAFFGINIKMVSLTKEYKPSDTNHKVYEDMFEVFQCLYESIKQYF